MNYWITTHWPPRNGTDPENIGNAVWLPDGREKAGEKLKPGDKILIYQSRTGRKEIRLLTNGHQELVSCIQGKGGIVAVCEAKSKLFKLDNIKPTHYNDGTTINWCWFADISIISKSGFLSRENTNKILGYKNDYNYRGFGDLHSGLKKISKGQFNSLVKAFLGDISTVRTTDKKGSCNTSESLEHYLLKHYVALYPSQVLNENDVYKIAVEYSFPTGDRADILLIDCYGRPIGTEIEVHVNDYEYAGLLQAIKYRYMSEPMTSRKVGDSRAVLVAYYISTKMKSICELYNIQYIEIAKEVITAWSEYGEGLIIKNTFLFNYRRMIEPNT